MTIRYLDPWGMVVYPKRVEVLQQWGFRVQGVLGLGFGA